MRVARVLLLVLGVAVGVATSDDTNEPLINYDHTPYDPSHAPFPKLPGKRRLVPDLYKRKYSEITWIGTHNSPALRTVRNGWSISGNQYFDLKVQLDSGIRMIQAQGHPDFRGNGRIRLCHTSCVLLDGGGLDDYLTTAKAWLDANPDEFISFLFVNYGIPLEQWAAAYQRTGFDAISYAPPSLKRRNMTIDDWPSVEAMVQSGTRSVTFLTSGTDEAKVPYLLPQFGYMFETSYANYDPSPSFACVPSRSSRGRGGGPLAPVPQVLSLVNHFLYRTVLGISYPYAQRAEFTNGAGFEAGQMGEHAARCRALYERRPNFVLVDFFSEGDVWGVEYGMNAY